MPDWIASIEIGCFAVGVARAAGASQVIASDLNPNRLQIAKAMGAEGIVVDKVSSVGDAFRAACKAQKEGKTTIVEMMCTRELGDPFRRDALKKPHRMLAKYKRFS